MVITKITAPIAKSLIGKRIRYLIKRDRSSRGSFYKTAMVTFYHRRNIEINNSDWLHFSEITSIEVIEPNTK